MVVRKCASNFPELAKNGLCCNSQNYQEIDATSAPSLSEVLPNPQKKQNCYISIQSLFSSWQA